MIRPTVVHDTAALVALTEGTGVFKPLEIVALQEVLNDYHAVEHALGHRAITYEEDGRILGFAYYAPADLTDRTWYLWWIVVQKSQQSKGAGTTLMKHVEADIARQNGRLLFIETSSLPHYDKTHRFYRSLGYELHAVLKDFYAAGDDMMVFRKQLRK